MDNTAHPSFRPAIRDYFDRACKIGSVGLCANHFRSTADKQIFSEIVAMSQRSQY